MNKNPLPYLALILSVILVGYPGMASDEDKPPEAATNTVAYLGVSTTPAGSALADQLKLPKGVGLAVVFVDPDSPANTVLQKNDVLEKINDQLLINHHQLAVLVKLYAPGDTINITFIRGGQRLTKKVKLGEKQAETQSLASDPFVRFNFRPPTPDFFDPFSAFPEHFFYGEELTNTLRNFHSRLQSMPGDLTPDSVVDEMEEMMNSLFSEESGNTHPGEIVSEGSSIGSYTIIRDGKAATLTTDGETRTFRVQDGKGAEKFNGPVTTDEDRAKVPEEYRGLLDQLENSRSGIKKTSSPKPTTTATKQDRQRI